MKGCSALDVADLRANPFAILGVSPRDGRDRIGEALASRLLEADADEELLHRAHQRLMAPRSRLQAEAAWLLGLAPSHVETILSTLRSQSAIALSVELNGTGGLARANLAAQLAIMYPDDSVLDHLIGAYDAIDPDQVGEIVNTERVVAGFPMTERGLVEEALDHVRSRHLEAALAALERVEHPGLLMTRLVEERLAAEGGARDFVQALATRYDSWSAPLLGKLEECLDAAIARLRAEATDAAACVHWHTRSRTGTNTVSPAS